MMIKRLVFVAALLPIPAGADEVPEPQRVKITAERDSEWGSYRHAYKAAAFFEAFTRSRPLIQAHMQVRPIEKGASLEGLSLHLVGEKTDVMIAVDSIGRATIPLLKQAYVDDAVLRLNRQKGIYYFSGRYSIKERADGVYEASDLRAACEQLLGAQRESGYRMRLIGKKCLGVKFVYASTESTAVVQVQGAGPEAKAIPLVDAHPFEGNSMDLYKVAIYRFSDWPQAGKVLTPSRPIAIGTLYD